MPAVLGFAGATAAGAALAPALRVLTWPLLGLNVILLGRGWYLEVGGTGHGRGARAKRSRRVLIASTAIAMILWGLRFAGTLGMRPL